MGTDDTDWSFGGVGGWVSGYMAVWSGLAEYINSIREMAFYFISFGRFFFCSLHICSIFSFFYEGVWLSL